MGRLRAALEKLNPTLPPEAITSAIDELTRDRSAMSPAAANREMHSLLKDGIRVVVADTEPSPQPSPTGRGREGGTRIERVRVIDWQNSAANDFLLVSQMSIHGPLYLRRPDLIGFVNGLPLVVVELKKPGVPAQQAFTDNLTCYKSDIPALFWGNALLIASNGTDSRVGSLTADWERFFEWKRIAREDEPRRVSLEVMIRGACDKTRLLDESIGAEGFTIAEGQAGARHGVIDLSKINFEVLAKKFKESKQKNLDIERLKAAIRATLDKIVHMHRALRTDYQQKFEELIAAYNAGSLNIDQLFAALLEQSRQLTEEQTRHVRENLLPSELVIFDILTRPAPELSDAERDEVKKVAKQLLTKVQGLLGTMWKGTQQGRSKVQDVIKDTLDEGLPRAYDKPFYEAKVEAVFEHFYETQAAG